MTRRIALVTLATLAGTTPRSAPVSAGGRADAAPPGVASAPVAHSAGPRPFQPGVQIDWPRREVLVAARVVLRAGPLELLACGPGKEHESILRLDAAATHLFLALGLLGVQAGHPPRWDDERQRTVPADGDPVDILLRWTTDTGPQTAFAHDWLIDIEYGHAPQPRPWVLAGSLVRRDGTLAADASGTAITLVDFPDALLAPRRPRSSRDAELWARANTPAIPALDTPVTLVLRPAVHAAGTWRLDFRGALALNGRPVSWLDAAEQIWLARRTDPTAVIRIGAAAALRSDVAALRRVLRDADVPAAAVVFVPEPGAP